MAKQEENLDDFGGWEQQTEAMDFFGSSEEVVSYAPKKEDEVEGKAASSEKKAKKEEEGVHFFGEDDEPEAAPNPKEDEEEDAVADILDDSEEEESEGGANLDDESEVQTGSLGTLAHLKEKGLMDYELEEGEELTEEKAATIIEDNWETGIEDRVGELLEDLPQSVKDLNKFAMAGGDVGKFFAAFAKGVPSTGDLDMSIVADQESLVRESLKAEGYDKDYVDTQLDFLKDSNKLKVFAENKKAKQDQAKETESAELATSQRAAATARKNQLKQTKTALSGSINKLEDVKGITLSKQDKKELPTYMVDRNIKLQNGSSITTMQKDLMEALQDEGKALFIAKLLRTDFDLTEIQSKVEEKITKKVKDGIRRNTKDVKGGKSSSSRNSTKPKKSLADYFND
tara:strand:- start:5947 stop:7146 length:1200 start_codon:yes stop_codon:yes gene_type:complete